MFKVFEKCTVLKNIVYWRVCIMYEDLKKEQIIVELKDLVNKAEEFKTDVDCYCEFMRETFLATSGLN